MKIHCLLPILLFVFSLPLALAKAEPSIVMLWPPDHPALKLTFEKFRQIGNYAGQSTFISDVIVQNLTDKKIARASFTVYFADKTNVRVGDGHAASCRSGGRADGKDTVSVQCIR